MGMSLGVQVLGIWIDDGVKNEKSESYQNRHADPSHICKGIPV